jgi:hypothetical protein
MRIGPLLVVLFWLPAWASALAAEPDGLRWDAEAIELVPDQSLDREALERAAVAWGGIPGVPEIRLVSSGAQRISLDDEWSDEDQDEASIAVTRRTREGLVIVRAQVLVNGRERYADGSVPYAYDLETLMVHELGHVLGLDHSPEDSSVMREGQEPGEVFREPSDKDVERVRALYAPPRAQYDTIELEPLFSRWVCNCDGVRSSPSSAAWMAICAIALAFLQRRRRPIA